MSNELCKLKGHMWYCSKRTDIRKEDGTYSIAIEKTCTRCLKKENLEGSE